MYNYTWCIPLAFISPCRFPFVSPLLPLYLLGTLLAVTGSVHLGLRLLVNWPPLSHPLPKPSPLQIPRTPTAQRLTKTTSGTIRRLLSGTASFHLELYSDKQGRGRFVVNILWQGKLIINVWNLIFRGVGNAFMYMSAEVYKWHHNPEIWEIEKYEKVDEAARWTVPRTLHTPEEVWEVGKCTASTTSIGNMRG
jgi:hypothetical protein